LLFDPHNPNRPVNFDVAQFHPDRLNKPLYWRKPRRIGVCFTGDLFDEQVKADYRNSVYRVMRDTTRHTYFVLTKQVERMVRWTQVGTGWRGMMPHVWHGVSICDQEDWDRVKRDFMKIPGKKWLSIEPLLAEIDLGNDLDHISLVVIGAESGPRRRPCDLKWVRKITQQIRTSQIKLYIKQLDLGKKLSHHPTEWDQDLQIREIP